MEQTRVLAASMMMLREDDLLFHSGVDMATPRAPRNESGKATLARIRKEMARPRVTKSARKADVKQTRTRVNAS
jgi:hypothetical protein